MHFLDLRFVYSRPLLLISNKFRDIGIGVELDCKTRFVGWPRMRRGKFGELATHHLMQVTVGLLTAAGVVEN